MHEGNYQSVTGKRPPSIVVSDLAREASRYQEAHTRANDSNTALHQIMLTHLDNLKLLASPLPNIQAAIPLPNTEAQSKFMYESCHGGANT